MQALERRTAEQEIPVPTSTPCHAELCSQGRVCCVLHRTTSLSPVTKRSLSFSAVIGLTVFSLQRSGWSVFCCAPNKHPLGDESETSCAG